MKPSMMCFLYKKNSYSFFLQIAAYIELPTAIIGNYFYLEENFIPTLKLISNLRDIKKLTLN